MSNSRFTVRQLTTAAVIAAVYTVLTTLLPIPQYGAIQLRVAEAMTVLPFFFPEAIPGLAVGCFLSNVLMSPIPLDWIFGTAATLLAALWTRRMPNLALAPLPPVLCNAVIVGAELTILFAPSFTWPLYWLNFGSVLVGELVICYLLGVPLILLLNRKQFYRKIFG